MRFSSLVRAAAKSGPYSEVVKSDSCSYRAVGFVDPSLRSLSGITPGLSFEFFGLLELPSSRQCEDVQE
jgi:hypothetical protein